MLENVAVPIIIVGFRNAPDIGACLTALSEAKSQPSFSVLICENGGKKAFDALLSELSQAAILVETPESVTLDTEDFVRTVRFRLKEEGPLVYLTEAKENLGYAGAVNGWLRVLAPLSSWRGVWVLNPDTKPKADALAELVAYSERSKKGMLGGRMIGRYGSNIEHSRGLRWRPFRASVEAVDFRSNANIEPDAKEVESKMDAPSGACMYVTRECVESIGFMDDRYFLYFEDLEWGIRAKRSCGVGYAWKAVVYHQGGTTIGTASARSSQSPLSVYLEFRNRVLFVGNHYKSWYVWTVAILALRTLEYLAVRRFANFDAAIRGLFAGLAGRTGRPDAFMSKIWGPAAD
jgi:N-acetylglucosaminyl-diphospho-decaprenol L-rhamnosyltransferase